MITNRAKASLGQPNSLFVQNGTTGHLVASVAPVKNTSLYEGRIKGPTGDWLPSVFTGDSQHIYFDGLTPGTTYTGASARAGWIDRAIRLERSDFAHGDVTARTA